MTSGLDFPRVAELLAEQMGDLARELAGDPTSRGRTEWRFRRKGSLAVVVSGPKRGRWFDHEAGEGGDALGFVAHHLHCPPVAALQWALGWLGLARVVGSLPRPAPLTVATPTTAPVPSGTADLARRIWMEGVPAAGTLVETYLAGRGLDLEAEAPLRFHPACPRGPERLPAMLALMTDPVTGEACGLHRTFLAADGAGKAQGKDKMMLGNAGIVRLVPDDEVTMGLGLAEGIETSLAVMQRYGWRPVWAATSAGGIRTFPVLAGIEALTVFADPDGAGLEAAHACAERWSEAGHEARVAPAPEGMDFADLVGRAVA